MCRDWGYYWLRLAIYIILGVGLGTLFFNIGFSHSSIQVRDIHPFILSLCCLINFQARLIQNLYSSGVFDKSENILL